MRLTIVLGIVLILALIQTGYSGQLPDPPPLRPELNSVLLYLRKIRDHHNNLKEVTTNPDGTIRGKRNELIAYNNSGSWKLCLNISSTARGGTTWVCTANALTSP